MKKIFCVIIAVAMALMLVAGCASSAPKDAASGVATNSYDGGYYASDSEYYGAPAAAEEMEAPAMEPAPQAAGLGTTDAQELTTPDYGGRKVIRNISISLETDTFDANMDALMKKVAEVGGYAESSNVDGKKPEVYNEPGRYGYFTFRIPVDRVDEFVADAKGCGTLLSCSENAEDITSRYFDMETRLSVLRTQLERLTGILVTTDNLADIIELETEIARVTLEIEELTTELRRYDGLVDYATVSVSLQELRLSQGPVAEKTVGQRISEDFSDSLYGVGSFCVDAFVWIVGALPVLLFIAAIAAALFFIIRGGKKRRAKREERRAAKLAVRAEKLRARVEKSAAAGAGKPEEKTEVKDND